MKEKKLEANQQIKKAAAGILTDAPDIERKKKFRTILKKSALAIIAVSLIVFAVRWFSPTEQVKRSFNRGISAFEKMDPRATTDCFSDSFTNALMPDKAALENMLALVFKQFKSVRVHIIEMKVEVVDKTDARVIVKGSIYFTDNEKRTYRAKSENPVTVVFIKENKRWKILSIEGMDIDLLNAAKEEVM